MLLDDWLNDWCVLLATFSPFFWKTILLVEFKFSFILRISTTHMNRLDQTEFGWTVSWEVEISKVRVVWCKKGMRIVWVHPSYCYVYCLHFLSFYQFDTFSTWSTTQKRMYFFAMLWTFWNIEFLMASLTFIPIVTWMLCHEAWRDFIFYDKKCTKGHFLFLKNNYFSILKKSFFYFKKTIFNFKKTIFKF